MTITDERLLEIAETYFDDPDEMSKALNEVAFALVELRRKRASQAPADTPPMKRMIGRPVPPACRQIQCPKCYADVVVFKGKKSGKEYLCDAEMGYAGNVRTMLTAPNWFHECGGKR